jgi:hypothetical protein
VETQLGLPGNDSLSADSIGFLYILIMGILQKRVAKLAATSALPPNPRICTPHTGADTSTRRSSSSSRGGGMGSIPLPDLACGPRADGWPQAHIVKTLARSRNTWHRPPAQRRPWCTLHPPVLLIPRSAAVGLSSRHPLLPVTFPRPWRGRRRVAVMGVAAAKTRGEGWRLPREPGMSSAGSGERAGG